MNSWAASHAELVVIPGFDEKVLEEPIVDVVVEDEFAADVNISDFSIFDIQTAWISADDSISRMTLATDDALVTDEIKELNARVASIMATPVNRLSIEDDNLRSEFPSDNW
jgi:hypothetical protein